MYKIRPIYRITCALRNLQNADRFEGAQEEKVCLADVPGLPTDPDD